MNESILFFALAALIAVAESDCVADAIARHRARRSARRAQRTSLGHHGWPERVEIAAPSAPTVPATGGVAWAPTQADVLRLTAADSDMPPSGGVGERWRIGVVARLSGALLHQGWRERRECESTHSALGWSELAAADWVRGERHGSRDWPGMSRLGVRAATAIGLRRRRNLARVLAAGLPAIGRNGRGVGVGLAGEGVHQPPVRFRSLRDFTAAACAAATAAIHDDHTTSSIGVELNGQHYRDAVMLAIRIGFGAGVFSVQTIDIGDFGDEARGRAPTLSQFWFVSLRSDACEEGERLADEHGLAVGARCVEVVEDAGGQVCSLLDDGLGDYGDAAAAAE